MHRLTCVVLLIASNCSLADEFLDRVAAVEKLATKKACTCEGNPLCCTCNACFCENGKSCRVNKALAPAPKFDFKHDCGCPSSASCNCGAGGCHCAENRAENRQPLRWRKESTNNCSWSLWRGTRQVGGVDADGNYRHIVGDRWSEPCKPPLELPKQTSMAPTTNYVCKT